MNKKLSLIAIAILAATSNLDCMRAAASRVGQRLSSRASQQLSRFVTKRPATATALACGAAGAAGYLAASLVSDKVLNAGLAIDYKLRNIHDPYIFTDYSVESSILPEYMRDIKKYEDLDALFMATFMEDLDSIKSLVGRVDLEATDGVSGYTPLQIAASYGKANAIKLLIEGGADLEAKNRFGTTPLQIAARHGDVDAIKALVEAGSDLEAKDRWGDTAYMMLQRYAKSDQSLYDLLKDLDYPNKEKE